MSQETGTDYAVSPEDVALDDTSLPEYEVDQYFPRRDAGIAGEKWSRLRSQFGLIRGYFKARPDQFREFQRLLNQARLGTTYDNYLTRTVHLGILVGVIGLALGLLLTGLLGITGLLGGIDSPVQTSSTIAELVANNRLLVTGGVLTILGGLLGSLGIVAARFYYPRFLVNNRRRHIDVVLPHGIVYMYALSYGGMNTFEVIKRLADTEDVYGEVAKEFEMIVRDVELFGNDLFTALRDARNLTPSDNLEQFLDDLISVLDSGSDVTAFFENESSNYMDKARDEQNEFLETLSILSEVFVVAFVAAPLFLIVTLVVISLLGGQGALLQTYLMVYLALPLGMLIFLLVVDLLSRPFQQPRSLSLENVDELDVSMVSGQDIDEDDPRVEEYDRQRRRAELIRLAKDPISTIRTRNPLLSLALTVPVAIIVAALAWLTGIVRPSAFVDQPILVTTGLIVVPLLIALTPLSVLHEVKRRREHQIGRRFPDTLNILSSANKMGIRLTEAFELVSRWSEGVLAMEMSKVRNDIRWNYNVRRALISLANRLSVPQVTRTMKLIAEGSRSTSDLSRILSIAAEDTRNRHELEAERRRAMSAYIAIVIIGFLVYLGVVVLLDVAYLTPISNLSSPDAANLQGNVILSVSEVPVAAYRTVFFHSALIQGVGSGLLAGKLADNEVLSGLKYSIGLVLLTLVIFVLI